MKFTRGEEWLILGISLIIGVLVTELIWHGFNLYDLFQ